MSQWLVKSEPDVIAGISWLKTTHPMGWNPQLCSTIAFALMKTETRCFSTTAIRETEIVGIASVIKAAYPDPTTDDPAWFAVDLKPVKKLKKPVTLEQIKKEKKLANMALVRISRLSVSTRLGRRMAVDPEKWEGFNLQNEKTKTFNIYFNSCLFISIFCCADGSAKSIPDQPAAFYYKSSTEYI
jgi:predicted RNA-binding protein with PUA-like domain